MQESDILQLLLTEKKLKNLQERRFFSNLRKKIPAEEFFHREHFRRSEEPKPVRQEIKETDKEKLKNVLDKTRGTGKAVLLDESLDEIRSFSLKGIGGSLKRMKEKVFAIVIDGIATSPIIKAAEEMNLQLIVAKNFATTDTNIKLLSL